MRASGVFVGDVEDKNCQRCRTRVDDPNSWERGKGKQKIHTYFLCELQCIFKIFFSFNFFKHKIFENRFLNIIDMIQIVYRK